MPVIAPLTLTPEQHAQMAQRRVAGKFNPTSPSIKLTAAQRARLVQQARDEWDAAYFRWYSFRQECAKLTDKGRTLSEDSQAKLAQLDATNRALFERYDALRCQFDSL